MRTTTDPEDLIANDEGEHIGWTGRALMYFCYLVAAIMLPPPRKRRSIERPAVPVPAPDPGHECLSAELRMDGTWGCPQCGKEIQ